MLRVAVLLFVLVAFAVAFVLQAVVVGVSRRRWPAAADVARRWWMWLPLLGAALLLIWLNVVVGLIVAVGLAVAMLRSEAVGSPFRPRR